MGLADACGVRILVVASSRFLQRRIERQTATEVPYFCRIELSTLANNVRLPPPPNTMLRFEKSQDLFFREKSGSSSPALHWGAGVDEHYWRRLCPATHLVRLVMSRPEDDRRRPERTPQRTGPTAAPRAAPGPSRSRCFILPRWWLQGGRALRAGGRCGLALLRALVLSVLRLLRALVLSVVRRARLLPRAWSKRDASYGVTERNEAQGKPCRVCTSVAPSGFPERSTKPTN